jgi:very-short-patch-repair endonuclease
MRFNKSINRKQIDAWIELLTDNKVDEVLKDLLGIRAKLRPYTKKVYNAPDKISAQLGNTAEHFKDKLVHKATEAEKKFKIVLKLSKYDYEFQSIIYYTGAEDGKDKFFIADFLLTNHKIVIELDGGYHNTAAQKELDRKRTSILKSKGYTVIRFTNLEVLNNNVDSMVAILWNKVKALTKEKKVKKNKES